jgi:hypothetical protein
MKHAIGFYTSLRSFILIGLIGYSVMGMAQEAEELNPVVDVVILKNGSRLSGTIIKWDLARGMQYKLMTGAEMFIPKEEIVKVYQDQAFSLQMLEPYDPFPRRDRPYAFKETGFYNTFSFFLNFSSSGGAGVHYSAGHRFSRLLGVGMGSGIESNDFDYTRNIVPLYVEARGFFLAEKISPYYAVKIGYGFALEDPLEGTIDAKGGFMFSPEIGVRFGGRAVNYYLGLEYKLQNATWTQSWSWDGSGQFTDVVSYRRVNFRTGILF